LKENTRVPVGHQIRARSVLVLDGEDNVGEMSLHDAIRLAESKGLDLVQFSKGEVPTCKVLDYGKFKYETSKKQKVSDRKQRESEIKVKEIKFRPDTAENDLRIKAKKTQAFLDDGCRVRVSIMFRGRESTLQAIARKTLGTFLSLLPAVKMSGNPSMEGNSALTLTLEPQ
jgi:translation initiation factor IF-3